MTPTCFQGGNQAHPGPPDPPLASSPECSPRTISCRSRLTVAASFVAMQV